VIIVDTGAWVGLANRRDNYHEPCRHFFQTNRQRLITTYPYWLKPSTCCFNGYALP